MGYVLKGRKSIECASKIAHVEIIKNPEVQAYVSQCVLLLVLFIESLNIESS